MEPSATRAAGATSVAATAYFMDVPSGEELQFEKLWLHRVVNDDLVAAIPQQALDQGGDLAGGSCSVSLPVLLHPAGPPASDMPATRFNKVAAWVYVSVEGCAPPNSVGELRCGWCVSHRRIGQDLSSGRAASTSAATASAFGCTCIS